MVLIAILEGLKGGKRKVGPAGFEPATNRL